MAYALGYISADGTVSHDSKVRAHYLKITSTDLERLKYFKSLLDAAHPIKELPKQSEHAKRIYALRVGDKKIVTALARLGIQQNKSLTMTLPEIPAEYFADYMRGYFDGDGCVYIEQTKGARGSIIDKAVRIIFTSGSRIFLEQLNERVCVTLGINKKVLRVRRAFQIRYGTSDSMQLFVYMYASAPQGALMRRKYVTFKKYFMRRQDKISKEVRSVLEYLDGPVVKG